jgi:hypothetical protein
MTSFFHRRPRGKKQNADPEYIVRLVGQVVRVSVETVRIVNDLPKEFVAVQNSA